MTKSIRTVLSPLLITNYVLGLKIVEFPTGRSRLWLNFLYVLLLWSTYYYLMCSTTMFYMNLYHLVHHICHWLNNFMTLLSLIIGMYYNKKFRYCLKKLAIIDITLEKLGTTMNYQQLYTKTVRLVVGWFVTAILINCMHVLYVQYQYNYGIPKIICISMVINYCSHINLIDDLTITSILEYIGLKFDQINKHLQNLASNNKQTIKRASENTLLDSSQCILSKTSSNKRTIWIIMHLHLELCKISREINSIFGIQMTFKMGCYFGFMAINLYEFFNIIFNKNFNNTNNIYIFTCIQITWFSHNILKLFLINYMCEKLTTKANATKTFANRVLYSTCDVEINENIMQLLLQMTQSPLRFYGLGLFQFGFKFLYGFTTSVTTVVVILIQAHTNK